MRVRSKKRTPSPILGSSNFAFPSINLSASSDMHEILFSQKPTDVFEKPKTHLLNLSAAGSNYIPVSIVSGAKS